MAVLGTTPDGDPLSIDLDRLTGAHLGIVANSGGGKSGLVRLLLEQSYGKVQHIILDGEDEFYTLREMHDYVIAGGDGGDIPLGVDSAERLAIAALTHGFSLIAQLNDLGSDGAPAFIGRFLTALVNAPRALWRPLLVVVDEAQRFAPRVGATEATDGIKALVFQGRKRGFTAVLAGTKFTEIDPSVRGMVNNWMMGRVGQAIDRNTMAEQLGFTPKEGRERLRGIEERQFYAMGPALTREPTLFRVSDVVTTPIHSGMAKVSTPPAPEALREILSGLVVPEPSDEAAKIKEVVMVQDRAVEIAASIKADAMEQRALKAEDLLGGLIMATRSFEEAWREAGEMWGMVDAYRFGADEHLKANGWTVPSEDSATADKGGSDHEVEPKPEPKRVAAAVQDVGEPIARGFTAAASTGELTRGATAMVEALAKHHPRSLPIAHVAKIAGVSMRSSQWRQNERSFESSSFVQRSGDLWGLSADGAAALRVPERPSDPAALVDFWVNSFPPSTGAMLRVIVANRRMWSSREFIADEAGVSRTSSGLTGGLRELRDHGLIEQNGTLYRAAAVLL